MTQKDETQVAKNIYEETATEDETDRGEWADKMLGRLALMAREQIRLEDAIASLQAEAKERTKELRRISEEKIPELMAELGLEEIRTADGARVKIDQKLVVSTTGKWREPINRWLEKTGNDDLIKDEIKVVFGSGEAEMADRLVQFAEGDMHCPAERKRYVAQPTLAALIREMMAAGEEVPLEEIGAHTLKFTKIARAK